MLSFIVKSPSFPLCQRGIIQIPLFCKEGLGEIFRGTLIRLIRIVIHKFLNLTPMPPRGEGIKKMSPSLEGRG